MKKNLFAACMILGLTGFAMPSKAFAQDRPGPDHYHKYLGQECYESAYPHSGSMASVLQPVAGLAEILVALEPLAVGTGATVVLIADGAGRMFGGECAGFTGVDDFVLKPLLKTYEGMRDAFSSPAVSTASVKRLDDSTANPSLPAVKVNGSRIAK